MVRIKLLDLTISKVKKKKKKSRSPRLQLWVGEEILNSALDTAAAAAQGCHVPFKVEEAHIVQLPQLLSISFLWWPVILRGYSGRGKTPGLSHLLESLGRDWG